MSLAIRPPPPSTSVSEPVAEGGLDELTCPGAVLQRGETLVEPRLVGKGRDAVNEANGVGQDAITKNLDYKGALAKVDETIKEA